MNEQIEKTKAGQGLGIAGFILGIVALIVSFIPCFGMYAIFPGAIGIILSAIALSQANKGNGAKGLIIAGLIVSIIGTAVASWQYYVITKTTKELTNWTEDLQDAIDEFDEGMDELEESGDLEDVGEALEGLTQSMQDAGEELSSEDFDKLIKEKDYDKVLEEYDKLVGELYELDKKADEGDFSVIGKSLTLATKLSVLSMKILAILPQLSQEQLDRFNEIDEKYKELNEETENNKE